MTVDPDQLAAITSSWPGALAMTEAGTDYVFIPGLTVRTAETQRTVDALLCPMKHGGYQTRLFLSAPIRERGRNWTQAVILGRTWHTWSWQSVPATLTLLQILSAHLGALR